MMTRCCHNPTSASRIIMNPFKANEPEPMGRIEALGESETALRDCPRMQLRNSRTNHTRKDEPQTKFQSPIPLVVDSEFENGRLPKQLGVNPTNSREDCLRNELKPSKNLVKPNVDDQPQTPPCAGYIPSSVPREICAMTDLEDDDGTEITLDPALPGTFCHELSSPPPRDSLLMRQRRVSRSMQRHVHDDIEYRPPTEVEVAEEFVPAQGTFGGSVGTGQRGDGLWKQVSKLGFEESSSPVRSSGSCK